MTKLWCRELSSEAVRGASAPGRAGLQPHPSTCPVSSFSLDSVVRDPRELWRFLTQNLSLPDGTAQALLAAQVDLPEVRCLLLGKLPALASLLCPPLVLGGKCRAPSLRPQPEP